MEAAIFPRGLRNNTHPILLDTSSQKTARMKQLLGVKFC
jgi:hypothetical protein